MRTSTRAVNWLYTEQRNARPPMSTAVALVIKRLRRHRGSIAALTLVLLLSGYVLGKTLADTGDRVTILYDAFGKSSTMIKDWGYSALVEYGGKRILFDTGNNPRIFAKNVKAAGVDLKKLDFVVISHRHLDHTAGLSHLLSVNPDVTIYAPKEAFGVFGSSLPSKFYRRQDSLPNEMRYFDGHPGETLTFGTVWPTATFVTVDSTLEVAPGVHLISLVSETVGTKELRELSMAIETPRGMIVVAGCSHPGIEKIVTAAMGINQQVHMVIGGLHLPAATDQEVARIAAALHDGYKVDRIAPGHCTGEPAFYLFRRTWKDQYTYAGVGSVIGLR
jgi:7,8-dihydropterin-6-yl-methyl-4-(beta-D-ribofuranosyl)aminobenzene 5'-phosphate synthase